MGRGALVLYLMTEENHEVAGEAGIPFKDEEELSLLLCKVLAMTEEQRNQYRQAAAERVRQHYSWDAVTTQYERLFEELRSSRK
jgi:glycosyltransferase involved in cell wall biosynthesis